MTDKSAGDVVRDAIRESEKWIHREPDPVPPPPEPKPAPKSGSKGKR